MWVCAVIGQHHIYVAAQGHTAKVAALQQEVEQLQQKLPEEYMGKEDEILAIAKKETVSSVCNRLHADIKLAFNSVRQRTEAISSLAGTHLPFTFNVNVLSNKN